ncbi:hypothetical protein ABTE92_19380, partial [Acinetobacter baumannii]
TLIFWMGRGRYVRVPPTHGRDPYTFGNVARTALTASAPGRGRPGWWVAMLGAALFALILLAWTAQAVVRATGGEAPWWPETFD